MDQSQDITATHLYRMANLYNAPDYVKQASDDALRGSAQLRHQASAYADPARRLYPIHTKAAVWLSYAFFLENKGQYKKADAELVEERILRAARITGSTQDVQALKAAHAAAQPLDEQELPDSCFGYIYVDPVTQVKSRYLPMRNSGEVVKAATYLQEHRHDFTYSDRRKLAETILTKAAEFAARVPDHDFLEKQAGHGACTAQEAVNMIRARVHASLRGPGKLTDLQAEMLKLAQVFTEKPAQLHEPGVRVKLAEVVDNFDHAAGLVGRMRDGSLAPVEDVLFGITRTKMASAQREHTNTITGNIYKLADVEKLHLDDVSGRLGDDIARAMTADGLHVSGEKAAAIIPTLPRGDAEAFDLLMSEVGAGPVMKEAAAGVVAVENSFLQELASFYRTGRTQ